MFAIGTNESWSELLVVPLQLLTQKTFVSYLVDITVYAFMKKFSLVVWTHCMIHCEVLAHPNKKFLDLILLDSLTAAKQAHS